MKINTAVQYHRIPMEEADYYDQASVVDYLNIGKYMDILACLNVIFLHD